jgi:hypothetical protein
MDAQPPAELPVRVVLLDQLLGRSHQVARQRNPVEVRDHERSRRAQHARDLGRRACPVEPVPALPGRHQVGARLGKTCLFRARHAVLAGEALSRVDLAGLLEHRRRGIDTDHATAAPREATTQAARAGAEIDHVLARRAQPEGRQPLEERVREAGAVSRVVLRRLAEVRHHATDPQRSVAHGFVCGMCATSSFRPSGSAKNTA